MAARKKNSPQRAKRPRPAARKKKKPPKPALFNTPFLDRFRTVFLGGPPSGWPLVLPFNRTAARVEIPLMLRVLLEVSDAPSIPSDVPPSALRTNLENFLAAEHWLDDRVPGVPPLRVRRKEIALIANLLMKFYHLGHNSGGSSTEWPPP